MVPNKKRKNQAMNADGLLIETLTGSQIFQDYEAAFTEANGLPVALRPVETWQLPLHGKRKENSWCAMMADKSRSCGACLQMQEKLAQRAMEAPAILTCQYGLCEAAAPLKLGGKTIGFLQTGQVMRQKPTPATFQRALAQAGKLGAGLDPEKARAAYFKTPVVPQKKLDSIMKLLVIFSDHLSMKANQIVVQQSNEELPVIARAKKFIAEHLSEDLSLGQVAQAVHTSPFYFCKLFKKATGVNFTEYVSRWRAEKAKTLLLNPNLRVSEIAYDVGFQSLTHFNRVFKRFMGQSPTEYRGQLPST